MYGKLCHPCDVDKNIQWRRATLGPLYSILRYSEENHGDDVRNPRHGIMTSWSPHPCFRLMGRMSPEQVSDSALEGGISDCCDSMEFQVVDHSNR